jgi:hypothetical protein
MGWHEVFNGNLTGFSGDLCGIHGIQDDSRVVCGISGD